MMRKLQTRSVNSCLEEIDIKSKHGSNDGSPDVTVGPFGVLQFQQTPNEAVSVQTRTTSGPADEVSVPSEGHPTMEAESIASETRSVDVDPLGLDTVPHMTSLYDSLQWEDIFDLGSTDMFGLPDSMIDPFQSQGIYDSDFANDLSGLPFGPPDTNEQPRDIDPSSTLQVPSTTPPSVDDILVDAPILMKHFQHFVIQHCSALPARRKSPWESVHLAAAVNSFAQLTFLDSIIVTNAQRAALYGLLAMSAYHLSKNPRFAAHLDRPVAYWDTVAEVLRTEAITRLQKSLEVETNGVEKAKYKDQLSATMSLLAVSVSFSNVHYDKLVLMRCR